MKQLKAAVIGTGFMGRVHIEGIRRLGNVEVAAVAGSSDAKAKAFADSHNVPQSTGDWKSLLSNSEIDAVHICTPNADHFPMAKAAMEAGKHVLLEKPITVDSREARELVEIAKQANVAACLQHNLRYYPVVQHVRQMVKAGDLGEILIAQGTYSQDWLLYDTDYNWRIDAEENGPLRVMGDIGSHWMDMVQHLTGLPIRSVCADLTVFHQTRKRPKTAIETFAGKTLQPEDYEEVEIRTEDFGMCLLGLGDRAKGCFSVSQVSAGNKNRFQFEIYGTKCGVMWNQERPDELWIGHRNENNQIIIKDPSLLKGPASQFADLPGGHSEGYDDSHKNVFRRFYQTVADRSAEIDYPTFEDGYRMMRILEACIDSHQQRCWVDVTY